MNPGYPQSQSGPVPYNPPPQNNMQGQWVNQQPQGVYHPPPQHHPMSAGPQHHQPTMAPPPQQQYQQPPQQQRSGYQGQSQSPGHGQQMNYSNQGQPPPNQMPPNHQPMMQPQQHYQQGPHSGSVGYVSGPLHHPQQNSGYAGHQQYQGQGRRMQGTQPRTPQQPPPPQPQPRQMVPREPQMPPPPDNSQPRYENGSPGNYQQQSPPPNYRKQSYDQQEYHRSQSSRQVRMRSDSHRTGRGRKKAASSGKVAQLTKSGSSKRVGFTLMRKKKNKSDKKKHKKKGKMARKATYTSMNEMDIEFEQPLPSTATPDTAWSIQWSSEYKMPYYYNRLSGKSVWEPPQGVRL